VSRYDCRAVGQPLSQSVSQRRKKDGSLVWDATFITGRKRIFTALKAPIQCPLVLQIRQGRDEVGRGEVKKEMLKLSIWVEFCKRQDAVRWNFDNVRRVHNQNNFFVLTIPISGRALLYVMVHSFAHSSFWRQQQEAGEHDYGAFMERCWQRKTELLGENPVRVLLCPPKIPL